MHSRRYHLGLFGAVPLPVLVLIGFLALHLEGTVIHDACHN